jgi:hypothetical protein
MMRTTRWTAVATLIFFASQLSAPEAWAQAQAPPKATGAAGAPTSPATPAAARPRSVPERSRELPLAP